MFKKIPYQTVSITSEKTIKDAMKKLNVIDEKFLIVTTKDDILLGTVTDGDIRRAILKGLNLNNKVVKCMNKKPIYANESSKNLDVLFKRAESMLNFLPQINKQKKMIAVLVDDEMSIKKTALIMAGGFGKRLGKITKETPKPLLKIGTKPILDIIIKKLEKANYDKVYISTHYLHEKIMDFVNTRRSVTDIQVIHEKKPLGTAGSIAMINNLNFENLTVLNGDVMSEIDLDALNQFHLEKNYDMTITVADYSLKIPYGVVDLDKKLSFKAVTEKPEKKYFVLGGIYCINKNVIRLVKKNYIDMPELIDSAKMLGKKIGVFPLHEYWNDIGSSKSLTHEKNRNKKN